jgi:hypothetical protein
LRAPDEEDPRTAWRPRGADTGDETGADPKHAVRAAAKLLHECETRREVEAWFERTPREAKAATTELSLARRGLAKLPDVTHFHGVTTLKLTRNRITNLPDDFGDALPCLETLEVRAIGSRGSRSRLACPEKFFPDVLRNVSGTRSVSDANLA